jgi:hypothetical protein
MNIAIVKRALNYLPVSMAAAEKLTTKNRPIRIDSKRSEPSSSMCGKKFSR